MPPTQQEAHRRHAEYYLSALRSADSLYEKGYENVGAGLRLFDLEWENIRAGQAWAAARRGDPALSKLCLAYPDVGAHVLNLHQHPKERIDWLEAALCAARELGDRHGEGSTLANLGISHADLGDARKAIQCYEQRLAIAREIGDRRGEAINSWNLGLAYAIKAELEKAIEAMQILIDFEREIGHADAEQHAARVEELRKKLRDGANRCDRENQ